ncbi:MAG: signal peptidase I [Lachnospiraceae bacterium]|nr:signal peptidase I [Lachnospiraceae bacterium]
MEEENKKEKIGGIKGVIREAVSVLIYLAIVFVLTYLVVEFVGQRTVVSGSSMESTLSDGNNLIVDKLSYNFKDPERFDIIVFKYQHEENTYYIKRIIGLPGETVQIDKDGSIFIDGNLLEEDYGNEVILNPGLAEEPFTLGEDEYFVLGDNRNGSTDSRDPLVGAVSEDWILGRAWVRIWPLSDFEILQHQ